MKDSDKGIRCVDFKIEGKGHGCVNWQGSVPLTGSDGMEVNNISLPKLLGFNNETGVVKETKNNREYKYKKSPYNIDLNDTPVYISANCSKHNLFREYQPFHIPKYEDRHVEKLITHPLGIMRGYVATLTIPVSRKAPICLESLVEQNCVGNYEVLSTSSLHSPKEKQGKGESGGLFGKFTIGDTQYVGFGSINIEDLQFISCDGVTGSSSLGLKSSTEDNINNNIIPEMKKNLEHEAERLNLNGLKPNAQYGMWTRIKHCVAVPQAGILLNEDAQYILVQWTIDLLKSMVIRQGKGWYKTTKVLVDYNKDDPFRIKDDENVRVPEKGSTKFHTYFKPATDEELKEYEKHKPDNKKPKDAKKGKTK